MINPGEKTVIVARIGDARRVRELPLRAHEAEAIDAAVLRHRLVQSPPASGSATPSGTTDSGMK